MRKYDEYIRTRKQKLKIQNGSGRIDDNCGKIWIPEAKRREMIKETQKMLAHAGADKVKHYIGNTYDMALMKDMVKEAISACEACLKNKVVTTATKKET